MTAAGNQYMTWVIESEAPVASHLAVASPLVDVSTAPVDVDLPESVLGAQVLRIAIRRSRKERVLAVRPFIAASVCQRPDRPADFSSFGKVGSSAGDEHLTTRHRRNSGIPALDGQPRRFQPGLGRSVEQGRPIESGFGAVLVAASGEHQPVDELGKTRTEHVETEVLVGADG